MDNMSQKTIEKGCHGGRISTMFWIDTDISQGRGIIKVRGLEEHAWIVLTSPAGEVFRRELIPDQGEACCEIANPILWNPEHPVLYKYSLQEDSGRLRNGKIGFRNIRLEGHRLLWNEKPVKLYGIAYRERKNDPEGTRTDLELFKKANINFLRSIYGPFDSYLLGLADEMGFFVEDTAPFWNIGTVKKAEQNLPHLEKNYADAAAAMLKEGMHTCVLIWSLGQDCAYGSNFRKMREVIRSVDTVRPVTFHLPMSIPEEEQQPDIWSCTFVDYRQDFDRAWDQMVVFHTPGSLDEIGYMAAADDIDIPVLQEAWSPVPYLNRDEIRRDPAIHEFWGRSIQAFADRAADTEGCLGGAVLAGVDEDGSLAELKDYKWGILDSFHTPKPEYREIQKAYAPASLHVTEKDGTFMITVQNRYCFTDSVDWKLLLNGKELGAPVLHPGETGTYYAKSEEKETEIAVVDASGRIISSWFERKPSAEKTEKKSDDLEDIFTVKETETEIISEGKRTRYVFSQKNDLLSGAWIDGNLIIVSGPWLDLQGMHPGKWTGSRLDVHNLGNRIKVCIEGEYFHTFRIRFDLTLDDNGIIDTVVTYLEQERHMPHVVKTNIGISSGGLSEKGITWILPGKDAGNVIRKYRKEEQELSDGAAHEIIKAFFPVTEGYGAEIKSDGSLSVLVKAEPGKISDDVFDLKGTWYLMNDYCGDYMDTQSMAKERGAEAGLVFEGTGIRLYGPLEFNCGKAEISVDGKNSKIVSEYLPKVDQEGASRGYEKRYGVLLYEADGLEEGEHKLTVRVLGEKEKIAQDTWFAIDYAEVEGPDHPEKTAVSILSDYNYPRLTMGCFRKKPVLVAENETDRYTVRIGRI